jgi:hypothetical protein
MFRYYCLYLLIFRQQKEGNIIPVNQLEGFDSFFAGSVSLKSAFINPASHQNRASVVNTVSPVAAHVFVILGKHT